MISILVTHGYNSKHVATIKEDRRYVGVGKSDKSAIIDLINQMANVSGLIGVGNIYELPFTIDEDAI